MVAGIALLTAAGVTATVLSTNNHKKTTKDTSKSCVKKTHHCTMGSNAACY